MRSDRFDFLLSLSLFSFDFAEAEEMLTCIACSKQIGGGGGGGSLHEREDEESSATPSKKQAIKALTAQVKGEIFLL